MTSHQPVDEPSPPGRPAPDDEPVRVPQWLRQPEQTHPVGGLARLRLFWQDHTRAVSAVVGAGLVLVLLLGVGWLDLWRRAGEAPRSYPTTSPPPGVSALTDARPAPPADIFAGTPAAAFAEGAAGITLPPARRTGVFSAAEVTAALADVRAAMLLARLDRKFMAGDELDRFVGMFAPDTRSEMRADFRDGSFASYATRLAPGARLTDDQPRVKGRVTYRATRDSEGIRVLEVTTNFVWAYAFRTRDLTPGAGVVVVHDTVRWHVPHPDDVEQGSVGLWLLEADSYASNMDCVSFDKGLLGLGAPDLGLPVETEDPDAMFDPDRSLDVEDTC
ncbi:hypothetical protein KBX06_11345 [Micromonospora sp. C31]|uniref:hypothetical protein n=1 Tax=Micromonospora sp. C31 TaxID=2824876 RepID=UPI001B3825E7|nr:hypothetical protein [Micromonospora sp. C31]MBQ1073748.1 hypothetical protein [Micromonospora sp. C31]